MAHPEFTEDPASVLHFIEFSMQFLQFVLGVPNRFDISLVILKLGSEHRIHGSGVCEITGFQHVHEKMDGCAASLIRLKYRVQRQAIPVEDLLDFSSSICLEIIDQNDEMGLGREEFTGRKAYIFSIPVGNCLAASDHPEPASWRSDR